MTTKTDHLTHMLEKARAAQKQAYAPYSNFHVGACIRTPNNHFFIGCNVENASYSLCQCAEATAIGAMISAGESQIAEIVIIGDSETPCTPCGACRQRLNEFAAPETLIHMFSKQGERFTQTLNELLPHSFGARHLHAKQKEKTP